MRKTRPAAPNKTGVHWIVRAILWLPLLFFAACVSPFLLFIGVFIALPLLFLLGSFCLGCAFLFLVWKHILRPTTDNNETTSAQTQSTDSYIPTQLDCVSTAREKVEVLLTPESSPYIATLMKPTNSWSDFSSESLPNDRALSRIGSALSIDRGYSRSRAPSFAQSYTYGPLAEEPQEDSSVPSPTQSASPTRTALFSNNSFGSLTGLTSDLSPNSSAENTHTGDGPKQPSNHASPARRVSLVRRENGRFSCKIHLPPGIYTCQYLVDDRPDEVTLLHVADPKKPLPAAVWLSPNLDVAVFLRHLCLGGVFDPIDVCKVIQLASALLTTEPSLLRVRGHRVYVCGDLHGNLDAFSQLIEIVGNPMSPDTQIVFLGDYVDRGKKSMEIVLGVCCLKIAYPNQVHLLRGNHECTYMSASNNLQERVKNLQIMDAIKQWFATLPLAAVVNDKFFCVHGGLSPNLKTVDQIETIRRESKEIPTSGLLCDLLWSDVYDDSRPEWQTAEFSKNPERGCAHYYGYSSVKRFLQENSLLSIVRAHEHPTKERRELFLYDKETKFPMVLTIYSSSEVSRPHSAFGLLTEDSVVTFTRRGFKLHEFIIPQETNVGSEALSQRQMPHQPEN